MCAEILVTNKLLRKATRNDWPETGFKKILFLFL